jgi:uncharacterized protein YbjT (DUF2867 family)
MTIEASTQSELVTLVTGATGKQGGAVARALLAQGARVRALVRDLRSPGANALRDLGASLVLGDFDDEHSLTAACAGARAVFSVQHPNMNDLNSDSERVQGKHLVDAARAAGVAHFVHTPVSGAGEHHRSAPGWKEQTGHGVNYWESKAYTEELVRSAGFRSWTVIKPSFFMENFVRPSFLFANFVEDRLLTALAPTTPVALVAVQDIGAAAAAAIADPERFRRVDLELAGDRLTMSAIAEVLSEALGTTIEAPRLTAEEAIAQGLMPEIARSQERMNLVQSPARPAQAQGLGLRTTDFRTWALAHLRRSGG